MALRGDNQEGAKSAKGPSCQEKIRVAAQTSNLKSMEHSTQYIHKEQGTARDLSQQKDGKVNQRRREMEKGRTSRNVLSVVIKRGHRQPTHLRGAANGEQWAAGGQRGVGVRSSLPNQNTGEIARLRVEGSSNIAPRCRASY